MKARAVLVAVLAATSSGGCDQKISGPDALAAGASDVFRGTVYPDGHTTWRFLISASGTVTVTLDSIDPAVVVGLSVGHFASGGCAVLAETNAGAGAASRLAAVVAEPGEMCVEVFDVGNTPDAGADFGVTIRKS